MDAMNQKCDQLDEVLGQWASHNQPSDERLALLRRRIAESETPPQQEQPSAKRPAKRYTFLTVVALALSLLAAVWLRPGRPPVPVPSQPTASEVAMIPQEHLESLLREMERLFDDRLAWVAETNREVLLGIEKSPLPSGDAPRVAVRVVVLRRDSGNGKWQKIWSGDVAARAEELVRVHSTADGSQLDLWTHVLPDGAVSVDMELAGLDGGGPTWRSSSVQKPLLPTPVLTTRQGGSEIQVWQTATVLAETTL